MSNKVSTTERKTEPTGLADFPFPVVYIDNESTGLDPERHSLFAIGAVASNGKEFTKTFRPRPGALVDDEAAAVNGMTPRLLDDQELSHRGGLNWFIDWLETNYGQRRGIVIAGMNPANVELAFLRKSWEWLGRNPRNFPLSHRTLDAFTMALSVESIARQLRERCGSKVPSAFDLDAVLCLPPEPEPHSALTGARRTAERFYLLQRASRNWHSTQPDKHIDSAKPVKLSDYV